MTHRTVVTKAEFVNRMERREAAQRRRRLGFTAGLAAAASLAVIGVLGPQVSPRAEAAPAILDVEFANKKTLSKASGVPAAPELKELAKTAGKQKALPGNQASDDQFVVIEAWYRHSDEESSELVSRVHSSQLRPDGSVTVREYDGTTMIDDVLINQTNIASATPLGTLRLGPNTNDTHPVETISESPAKARETFISNIECIHHSEKCEHVIVPPRRDQDAVVGICRHTSSGEERVAHAG